MDIKEPGMCMFPWLQFLCCEEVSLICCYGTQLANRYKLWEGPWKYGFDFWNSPKIVEFRQSMLTRGAEPTCRTIHCPFFEAKGDKNMLEHQKFWARDFCETPDFERIIASIRSGRPNPDFGPSFVYMAANRTCNCRCSFCRYQDNRDDLYPDLASVDRFLELLRDAKALKIGGGEPMIQSKQGEAILQKIVGECNQRNVPLEVLTNGHGLTLDRYEEFAVNGPIGRVTISLDTIDPEAYRLHRGSDVERVRNNIEQISANHKKHCIECFGCVLTAWNYRHVKDLIRFASDNGVKGVVFSPVVGFRLKKMGLGHANIFRAREGYTEAIHQEVETLVPEWRELAKELGVTLVHWHRVLKHLDAAKREFDKVEVHYLDRPKEFITER